MKMFYLVMAVLPTLLTNAHAAGVIQINPGGSVDIDPDDGRTKVVCNAPMYLPPIVPNGPVCNLTRTFYWGQVSYVVMETVTSGSTTSTSRLSGNGTYSFDDALKTLGESLEAGICGSVKNHQCTVSQTWVWGNAVWQIVSTESTGNGSTTSQLYSDSERDNVVRAFRRLRELGYCNAPYAAPPLIAPVAVGATPLDVRPVR